MELEKHKLSLAAILTAFILVVLFFILDFVYQKQFIKTEALVNNISREENKNAYSIDYMFQYKNEYINRTLVKRGEIKEKIGDTNTVFYNAEKNILTNGNNYFRMGILLLIIFLTFMIPITVFRIEV